jgi:protein phosphatase
MSFLPGNAQHIGSRGSQQDSFGFGDPHDKGFLAHGGFVAVVCDGMGGLEYGDLASRVAVRAFLDAYARKLPEETIPEALERSVREANARVVELAHEKGAADQVGTTLVAASFLENGAGGKEFYFISVGDSGIFHVSAGHMRMINHPHTFAAFLDEAVGRGSLSREQALLHPERESLTSFIGMDVLDEIDSNGQPWPLRSGDTVMLASDGLFKTLSEADILSALHGRAPEAWADTLVAATLAAENQFQDNVTVLTVNVNDRPDTLKLPPPPAIEVASTIAPAPARRPKRLLAAALIGGTLLLAGGGGLWYRKHHAAQAAVKK